MRIDLSYDWDYRAALIRAKQLIEREIGYIHKV